MATQTLTLSKRAIKKVQALIAKENSQQPLMLRVMVSGGGCAGFQYGFSLDDQVLTQDHIFEQGGVKMVIDEASLNLLSGSEIDFREDLAASTFIIHNPNASSGCGCGNSFSL